MQMQLYLYLSGLKVGKFVYENKNTQDCKQYIVIRDDHMLAVEAARARNLRKVLTMRQDDGTLAIPKQPFEDADNFDCRFCPYRSVCWK
jgi:CRISPR/Cas system-associated exonuclease Cas4 (RecB family)